MAIACKYFKQGDTAGAWKVKLTANKLPVDISGGTVTLKLRPAQGELVELTAPVTDGPEGEAEYQPDGSEPVGGGRLEILVVFQDLKEKRFPTRGFITYEIQPNLG